MLETLFSKPWTAAIPPVVVGLAGGAIQGYHAAHGTSIDNATIAAMLPYAPAAAGALWGLGVGGTFGLVASIANHEDGPRYLLLGPSIGLAGGAGVAAVAQAAGFGIGYLLGR